MNLINISLWLNRSLAAAALVTLFATKDAVLTGSMLAAAMCLYLVHQSLCARIPTSPAPATLSKSNSSAGSEYRNLQEQFNRHDQHAPQKANHLTHYARSNTSKS